MNKSQYTFEQLCIRKESGFSCDVGTMFMPSDPDSFDDVVFKIICKIDTNLLLLKTHGEDILRFTVIAIPLSCEENQEQNSKNIKTYQGKVRSRIQPSKTSAFDFSAVQYAWEYLSSVGWHCLQSLAVLQPESIPDNGSRMYSVYQYTTCILDVIRANYMFQKHTSTFHHETLEMFDEADIKGAKQAVFGLLWKRSSLPLKGRKFANLQTQRRKSSIPAPVAPIPPKKAKETILVRNSKQQQNLQVMTESLHSSDSENDMEIDDEITFKKDHILLTDVNVPQRGHRKMQKKEDSPPPSLPDVTLGFETSTSVPPKDTRKSMARKSLSSDWPEEERQNVLRIFDNLNPNVSEQKRIALTCKYVALQMGKDLPSKLLYQWVQKKGREVERTITSFSIPEGEQKVEALKFYRELNDSNSESARVGFTLKYLDAQFGLNITSKQLFTWLTETPTKKTQKRR